ncbi:tetratricopeptide repeat protein [Maricaulis salignorans]|uniref:Tetratricopeptide repeat-containing protein n=1 Tax=Maricaulis salignorans TaxID=144026 RepID=A0A1G9SW90_9PROT|nr:tetratricopeptide repeat protein [Maricaulis salignorans]SDM39095.1 Tetratricopeptide repeat-containing protein [Maricaulis salignorans]
MGKTLTMRNLLAAAGLAALINLPALGQASAEGPASALPTPQSIAMELFGGANSALRSGDYESARRMLEAALDLKPGHPAILRGLYRVATSAERPGDALEVLERMADAGLGFDTGNEIDALGAADASRLAAVQARLAGNVTAAGRAERAARIDRPDALIEGVAVDIETDRIFLSSVANREILMLEPFAPNDPVVFADREDGLWSVFGIAVDDRSRMVWAASGVVPQTPLEASEQTGTALFAFDMMTGDLYRRFEIDGAGRLADFVVRDGIVYVSDADAPRIYVLNSISSQLELLVEDPRFVSLQGLALAHGALYVADYAMGIWRVDLGDHSVSLVRAGDESLIGIDGFLNTREGRLIAVRNGVTPHQVMAIDLDATGHAVANIDILLRGHRDMAGETEPTLIDLADGRGWLVANAAWPLFPEDGSAPDTPRPATVILELDLP